MAQEEAVPPGQEEGAREDPDQAREDRGEGLPLPGKEEARPPCGEPDKHDSGVRLVAEVHVRVPLEGAARGQGRLG